VVVKSTVEATMQSEGLRDAMLATEAGARTLVTTAEKIARSVEDLQAWRATIEREGVD
jgi:hypothetical protein